MREPPQEATRAQAEVASGLPAELPAAPQAGEESEVATVAAAVVAAATAVAATAMPAGQDAGSLPSPDPFGSWHPADLRAMPRFPQRDSFSMAKELISNFVQDDLNYQDLRVGLFWLGFGLLEVPSPRELAMSLVPLCKDLDTYADMAVELGYDPTASVHSRPVPLLRFEEVGAPCWPPSWGMAQTSSSSHSSAPRQDASSSSSAGQDFMSGAAPSGRSTANVGVCGASASSRAAPRENAVVRRADVDRAAWPPTRKADLFDGDDQRLRRKGHSSQYLQVVLHSDLEAQMADVADVDRSASSSMPFTVANDAGASGVDDQMEVIAKVKLMHAGGWSSSDSSGSEGQRTPPRGMPASSSAAQGEEAGGLDADHVEQFTVTFVTDLETQEDLQAISCLCTFCLDDMKIGEQLCRLPCMHTFHRRCVHAWLERDRRCMLCRLDITRPCG